MPLRQYHLTPYTIWPHHAYLRRVLLMHIVSPLTIPCSILSLSSGMCVVTRWLQDPPSCRIQQCVKSWKVMGCFGHSWRIIVCPSHIPASGSGRSFTAYVFNRKGFVPPPVGSCAAAAEEAALQPATPHDAHEPVLVRRSSSDDTDCAQLRCSSVLRDMRISVEPPPSYQCDMKSLVPGLALRLCQPEHLVMYDEYCWCVPTSAAVLLQECTSCPPLCAATLVEHIRVHQNALSECWILCNVSAAIADC